MKNTIFTYTKHKSYVVYKIFLYENTQVNYKDLYFWTKQEAREYCQSLLLTESKQTFFREELVKETAFAKDFVFPSNAQVITETIRS